MSLDQQIERLKSHNLVIHDEEQAKQFLTTVNYYRLSGYLHAFKQPGSNQYVEGLTFETISRLYLFDCRFTRLLMYVLEDIEESLKTRFSYTLSSSAPEDPCIYLNKQIYRDLKEFRKFKSIFEQEKKNNSELPFIKHHDKYYNGLLPIWVAVEIFTMGNLNSLYVNLLPTYQKRLARQYGTGTVQLKSWVENMTYTRNHLAHYMRIYNYNFGRTPALCSNHKRFTATGRIFDQIMVMSYMYSNSQEWNGYVLKEIGRIFKEFSDVLDLKDIGFPSDWKKKLRKQ